MSADFYCSVAFQTRRLALILTGLYYYVYLVSLGRIKPPEGMEEQWVDPFPLPLKVLALVKWILIVLFQVRTGNQLGKGGKTFSLPTVLLQEQDFVHV